MGERLFTVDQSIGCEKISEITGGGGANKSSLLDFSQNYKKNERINMDSLSVVLSAGKNLITKVDKSDLDDNSSISRIMS